jgi:hypothetical protein
MTAAIVGIVLLLILCVVGGIIAWVHSFGEPGGIE